MVVPPVVIWTVAAAGVVIVARLIVREWQRANNELSQARAASVAAARGNPIPRLRRDPTTGVYRPSRRD